MTYDEAVQIYLKAIPGASQPCAALSTCKGGTWYLRNVNSFLARIGARSRKVF
jgi:hypothetical protein